MKTKTTHIPYTRHLGACDCKPIPTQAEEDIRLIYAMAEILKRVESFMPIAPALLPLLPEIRAIITKARSR